MDFVEGEPFIIGLDKILRTIAEHQRVDPDQFQKQWKADLKKNGYLSLSTSSWQYTLARWKYGIEFNPAE
jgi:hypothetical protein